MIGLALGVKVYLCTQPKDMRRGFDGLSVMAESLMEQNPLSGHLFVFRNRNRDKLRSPKCFFLPPPKTGVKL